MKTEREKFEKFAKRKKYTLIAATTEGKHEYLNQKTHTAWEAWQAAKADTIPEGYVLMPKEPTKMMIDVGMDGFCFPLDGGCFSSSDLACAYKAMIEAQEQSK